MRRNVACFLSVWTKTNAHMSLQKWIPCSHFSTFMGNSPCCTTVLCKCRESQWFSQFFITPHMVVFLAITRRISHFSSVASEKYYGSLAAFFHALASWSELKCIELNELMDAQCKQFSITSWTELIKCRKFPPKFRFSEIEIFLTWTFMIHAYRPGVLWISTFCTGIQ